MVCGSLSRSFSDGNSLRLHLCVHGSVIVGATKFAQLEDNLKALDFQIPTELNQRLEVISRPEVQFPYSFFESDHQKMIHGNQPVGFKPMGYYPNVLITGS